jgi:hypothetical protein
MRIDNWRRKREKDEEGRRGTKRGEEGRRGKRREERSIEEGRGKGARDGGITERWQDEGPVTVTISRDGVTRFTGRNFPAIKTGGPRGVKINPNFATILEPRVGGKYFS